MSSAREQEAGDGVLGESISILILSQDHLERCICPIAHLVADARYQMSVCASLQARCSCAGRHGCVRRWMRSARYVCSVLCCACSAIESMSCRLESVEQQEVRSSFSSLFAFDELVEKYLMMQMELHE